MFICQLFCRNKKSFNFLHPNKKLNLYCLWRHQPTTIQLRDRFFGRYAFWSLRFLVATLLRGYYTPYSLNNRMSYIDLSTIPSCIPSICIPRIFPNISEKQIRYVFSILYLGVIDRIDIIPTLNKKGEPVKCVYIHFRQWNTTVTSINTRKILLEGKCVKVMYDEPWFWKVYAKKMSITHRRTVPYIIQECEPLEECEIPEWDNSF